MLIEYYSKKFWIIISSFNTTNADWLNARKRRVSINSIETSEFQSRKVSQTAWLAREGKNIDNIVLRSINLSFYYCFFQTLFYEENEKHFTCSNWILERLMKHLWKYGKLGNCFEDIYTSFSCLPRNFSFL